jgi:hypothetical protein
MLTERSSIGEVAAAVAGALGKAGIRAVLSGGGCASLYTGGLYQSEDLDFILQSASRQSHLDQAMAQAGFSRRDAQYFHERSPYYVEFPRGPLSVGDDYRIEPVELTIRSVPVLALSATDACRDRLAAFLHWRDQQSLKTAVWIALRNRINLDKIRSWCESEGSPEGFDEFSRAVTVTRRGRARARRRRENRRPKKR